jgi:hypothetical protein
MWSWLCSSNPTVLEFLRFLLASAVDEILFADLCHSGFSWTCFVSSLVGMSNTRNTCTKPTVEYSIVNIICSPTLPVNGPAFLIVSDLIDKSLRDILIDWLID